MESHKMSTSIVLLTKSGLMLFKYKMVTQVKVKSNVKKGEADSFLVKASVHASMKKA